MPLEVRSQNTPRLGGVNNSSNYSGGLSVNNSPSNANVSVGSYNPGTISSVGYNYGTQSGGNPQGSVGGWQPASSPNGIFGGSGGGGGGGGNGTNGYPRGGGYGSGGGGGGPVLPDTSAARNATQQALDSLDRDLVTARESILNGYRSLVGDYDLEAGRVKGDYNRETGENTQDLLRNRQNALLAAAQGHRGLRGVLGALGALSGDGSHLAAQAVQNSANADLGGAADTYQTNAATLDRAKSRFDEDDRLRREKAISARDSQFQQAERSNLEKRQSLLEKLASLFTQSGINNEAAARIREAGSLNSRIAGLGGGRALAFTPQDASYNPGELDNYRAGAGDMTVTADKGDTTGSATPTLSAGRAFLGRDDERF